MKKFVISVVAAVALLMAGYAVGERVRDWHDLDAVRGHVHEAIGEMERARAANHYDMDGHGEKAEKALRNAEHELEQAVTIYQTYFSRCSGHTLSVHSR